MARTITTDELCELVESSDPQLVEVLPKSAYDEEHLPGAVCVPLTTMDRDSVAFLDRNRPVVTYCFDYQCDLSARAASRLVTLGFDDVYDYTASKAAWFAAGLPAEGSIANSSRAGAIARPVPTCPRDATIGEVGDRFGDDGVLVVVDDEGVVLGLVRDESVALPADTAVSTVMQPGPPSVRPSITAAELATSMEQDHRPHVLVTTLDGHLMGIIAVADLHGQH